MEFVSQSIKKDGNVKFIWKRDPDCVNAAFESSDFLDVLGQTSAFSKLTVDQLFQNASFGSTVLSLEEGLDMIPNFLR
jgi:hypothetical protein